MYPLHLLPLVICTAPLVLADMRHHRLPNGWTATLALLGLGVHGLRAVATGSWFQPAHAVGIGIAGLAAMWVLRIVVRGGLGFGDVKLVGALGCVLAQGWLLFACVFVAFCAASLWVLPQLLRGRTRESNVAFGPFILLGAWLLVPFA